MPYVRRLMRDGESLVIGGLIRLTFRKDDGRHHVIVDAPPGVKITPQQPPKKGEESPQIPDPPRLP